MLRLIAYGSELNLVHPPRPAVNRAAPTETVLPGSLARSICCAVCSGVERDGQRNRGGEAARRRRRCGIRSYSVEATDVGEEGTAANRLAEAIIAGDSF